ncbi:MAG: 4-(cytidine 5'-diphospho)-2-C-methyl-D-erythritol kinase [Actinomycetota bacterium]|nr:4-(cytidine 5'-diphospho)-2-C-methyl-D-erythritol kinase [Actinomycetota bacterium]
MDEPLIRLRTYAKINLFLGVRPGRADGYHDIDTIFHAIDLSDDMELRPRPGGEIDVRMALATGVQGAMPVREDNLVFRAAMLLARHAGVEAGARIDVTKRVPIGAGLAGGSANAAGALIGLNELWAAGLNPQDLQNLAQELGSDVPFCLVGGTARGTGRGEVLVPLTVRAELWFVLGLSRESLATTDVYRTWDELPARQAKTAAAMAEALGAGGAKEIGLLLHNDLEAAAFRLRPDLVEKKELLRKKGALGACLSGSGPTLVALAVDEPHAREIAARVASGFDRAAVASSRAVGVQRLD